MAKQNAKAIESKEETKKTALEESDIKNTPLQNQEDGAAKEDIEVPIEQKLKALYELQQIDSQIDRIRIVRGELPLEVEDLEDEVTGLGTRIDNYIQEIASFEQQLHEKNASIKEKLVMIKRYEEQQNNVRNNREYDALSKEIEYQNIEIQIAEKAIGKLNSMLSKSKEEVENAQRELTELQAELDVKQSELSDIVAETEMEEKLLLEKSETQQKLIDERLLVAYKRIRKNARNGLAVVPIERDACGGCFSSIPPQKQLDIKLRKKIIVCEFFGRILVDYDLAHSNDLDN